MITDSHNEQNAASGGHSNGNPADEHQPPFDPHARMKVQTVSLKDAERIPYEPPRPIVYTDGSGSVIDGEFVDNKALQSDGAASSDPR